MWYKVGEWGTQCMVRVRWGCWVRVLCFLCGVYVLYVPGPHHSFPALAGPPPPISQFLSPDSPFPDYF